LFRLVNFFKPQNVIEIGSSTGVMGLYLGMPSRRCNCLLLDERHDLSPLLKQFTMTHHYNKIQYIAGDYRDTLHRLQEERREIDLLFINRLPKSLTFDELFQLCRPLIGRRSILLLDNIGRNRTMRRAWQSLRQDTRARVMIDLHALGMIFFDEKLHKQHYKAYFDDKQKPHLHPHRRPRLHLARRRKKNYQDPPAH
jgi:predicted O-methyltransferase YrrM